MTKEQVKQSIKMPEVLTMYGIQLKKNKCHCPFHNEKTASFTVFADGLAYKCFGCNESGDVFSFVMKMDNVAFPDALKRLGGGDEEAIPFRPKPTKQQRETRQKELNLKRWINCIDFIKSKKPPFTREADLERISKEGLELILDFVDDEYVNAINKLQYLEYKVFEE